jgi:predicted TIM-barrel fold metal-dependent hydrolase
MANAIIDSHVHVLSPDQAKMVLGLMDEHQVKKALALVGIGLSPFPAANEGVLAAVHAFPDRLPAAMVGFSTPEDLSTFDGERAAKEVEPYLKLPEVKGVGEWALEAVGGMDEWTSVWPRLRPIMDVVAENNKAVLFHTGMAPFVQRRPAKRTTGHDGWVSHRSVWWHNPVFLDDVAVEYPDVPVIIAHVGVQGCFFYGSYADMALMVAAKNPNVYLETSSAPSEVVAKALAEPAIGASRILFGTDTPAPFDYYQFEGSTYPSYSGMALEPTRIRNHYPECLRVIEELDVSPDQKQMILGGNAARLFNL